jgi:hypothetical protein
MPCLFRLRQETDSFLETAPWIFKSEIELDITVDECFHILVDDRSWEVWHPEVTNIQWKTDPPHGKGSIRTVVYKDWLSYLMLGGPVAMEEEYDGFEDAGPTKSFSVSYTAIGRPTFMMYRACREEFKVEPIEGKPGHCRFKRIIAVDPAFLSRYIFGCITYPAMKDTLSKKCPQRLQQAIKEKKLPILDQP